MSTIKAVYYLELMEAYPQALFVSTERDIDEWFSSFSAYLNVTWHYVFRPANMPITITLLHKYVVRIRVSESRNVDGALQATLRACACSDPSTPSAAHQRGSISGYNPAGDMCRFFGLALQEPECPIIFSPAPTRSQKWRRHWKRPRFPRSVARCEACNRVVRLCHTARGYQRQRVQVGSSCELRW